MLAQKDRTLHRYNRVKLVDTQDRPITIANLKVGESYLFLYPYITTPCFLINLGNATVRQATLETEDGATYQWRGGVGPQRSVVAFSAICAHMMTHPTRVVNFINYRHKAARFKNKDKRLTERSKIIYCCSEKSVYDPTNGARVMGGPAPQPLAAILLEYDDDDGALYAAGTYGGDMFDKFFEEFKVRLELEYLTTDIRREVVNTAMVMPVDEYCDTQVLC
ncbi:MAG: hypothetical protein ACE5NW_10250 [Acidiferrobacterales bacterium]